MIIHVSHIVGSKLKEGGGAKPKKKFLSPTVCIR